MQISFVMLIFSIVFYCFQSNFFGGRGKLLEREASSQPNNVSGHGNELFSREALTNSCAVCRIVAMNALGASGLGLIFWAGGGWVKASGGVPSGAVDGHPGLE